MKVSTKKKNKIQMLKDICLKFKVEMIYVFGSRAREVKLWTESPKTHLSKSLSDIDIGVKTVSGNKLSIKNKVLLTISLEEFFNNGKVDLAVIPEIDPFLAANIIRGQRLYCLNDFEADEYELYILRRAGDLAPLERERQALIAGNS